MTGGPAHLPTGHNPWPTVPRECGHCGHDALRVRRSEGENDAGKFQEKYICGHCNATGTVSGYEHKPDKWTYSGEALAGFEE